MYSVRKQAFLRKLFFLLTSFVFCVTLCFTNLFRRKPLQNPVHEASVCADRNCIEIGIVVCGGVNYFNVSRNAKYNLQGEEEAITLIKSIILSAKSYNVQRLIQVSVFSDSFNLKYRLKKKISEVTSQTKDHVKIKFTYYSAYKALPDGYEKLLIDGEGGDSKSLGCRHVRLFFPDSLPSVLNTILYLDTDNIITGNISLIYDKMLDQVDSENSNGSTKDVLAVMGYNSELHDLTHDGLYKFLFGKIPHVPPRGVNSGVMFMNLRAMRNFNWTQGVMDTYLKHKLARGSDQRLINILFHNNLDKLRLVSCQYNFQHIHCENGLTCKEAVNDENGIQILHGAGGKFSGRSPTAHFLVYEAYKKFDWQKFGDIKDSLYKPLRVINSKIDTPIYEWDNCRGNIGELLYTKLL